MDFLRREDGAVALIFGLMAIPFIALVGWSVDYLRLHHVKDFLQAQADAAAIHALAEDTPEGQWRLAMLGEIQRQYQGDWARDITVEGDWVGGGDEFFRVTASADVPLAFMLLIPGIPDVQLVSVAATAQLIKPELVYEAPVFSDLNPDAGDYNRMWLYCYWPDRVGLNDPERPVRTQMVPIADNSGTTDPNGKTQFHTADLGVDGFPVDNQLRSEYQQVIEDYTYNLDGREKGIWRQVNGNPRQYHYLMPRCPSGSHMGYRLENVRFSRTQIQYWDTGAAPNSGGDGHTGRFNYYSDTVITSGQPEVYDGLIHPGTGQRVDMLETVLCDSIAQCKPVSEGGIIPEGPNRTPQKATGACSPGKYMYYGWEDRPPGVPGSQAGWQHYAWTDRSYDDIRIVIKCPEEQQVGERNARLVG
jgi:hypothetical protein